MKKQDFYFELPPSLIAQYPLPSRSDSRLLSYDKQNKQCTHHVFKNLPSLLKEGDLLVFNNSKVIPARFFGSKSTGGKVEFLLERVQSEHTFLAHIKASKTPQKGSLIQLADPWQVTIEDKLHDLYLCKVNGNVHTMLKQIGHMPLPPYIERNDEVLDQSRYQTVYAEHDGSVAAPTAGLHFDEETLSILQAKGIQFAYTTLHVGAGTFRPVRCDNIKEHVMHSEYFEVSQQLCDTVNQALDENRRVIAVGTTAMRTLESAAKEGRLQPFAGDTNIFIYPGFQFQICKGLMTNFHLPESTLLMLVAAFIGHSEVMSLYAEAIKHQYRFFSYGDTSILL